MAKQKLKQILRTTTIQNLTDLTSSYARAALLFLDKTAVGSQD